MKKFSIGIDFGTLSGRAVLVDLENGQALASSVYDYPHAVMDRELPTGEKLGPDWALQHPQDYLDVIFHTVPELMQHSGVSSADVVGIGIDVTACTIFPTKADGTPLCFLEEYRHDPHAWVKLWKHHAAQAQADRLNAIAEARGEDWLKYYGGRVSCEWLVPKVMQILEESPAIYDAADRFVEAADWIVWQLCGSEIRSSCTMGYKALWNEITGYPDPEFFRLLDPRLEHFVEEKMDAPILPLAARAGGLTKQMAAALGLQPGIAIATGIIDAHAGFPAAGIDGPAKMLVTMGTSSCHMMVGTEKQAVPGIVGVVSDGIVPGYFGYEAGQACVGDHYAWLIQHCVPAAYSEQAAAEGKNLHTYLSEKAAALKPGESGLVALDWWNGCRSVLDDSDLTGMMLGMTLQTTPEEMYRALMEATAYGTRNIIETFRRSGVPVHEIYATGGISKKNPVCMQIYADVLNLPIRITEGDQGAALGSAIYAAVAAGSEQGGYDDMFEATRAMGNPGTQVYHPIPEHTAVYDRLYAEYLLLHDYFGRGANDVMKRLKAIRREAMG